MKNSNKSFARYLLVQAIYQKITSKSELKEVIEQFDDGEFKQVQLNFDDEFVLKKKVDYKYFKDIIHTFSKNEKLVIDLINQNISKNWRFERIPYVLKAILISSVSEIITNPEISIGIITSEYIRLTESFFLDRESAFVNAFISKIYSSRTNIENVK
tara:strand:+ start:8485 stop:8955 length:471 start_codon:yes stop_codon:yes gene_type:complete